MEKKVISKPNAPVNVERKVALKPNPSTDIKRKAALKPNPSINVGKKVIPKPNTSITPEYKTIGKKLIDPNKKETIPEEFIPTPRMGTILGIVFLAVVILALVQIPYGELLKGNLEIKIGFPLVFLDFEEDAIGSLPVKYLNLTLDIIMYIILSYIIDVALSFMLKVNTTRTRQQEGKGPKVYETQKN